MRGQIFIENMNEIALHQLESKILVTIMFYFDNIIIIQGGYSTNVSCQRKGQKCTEIREFFSSLINT